MLMIRITLDTHQEHKKEVEEAFRLSVSFPSEEATLERFSPDESELAVVKTLHRDYLVAPGEVPMPKWGESLPIHCHISPQKILIASPRALYVAQRLEHLTPDTIALTRKNLPLFILPFALILPMMLITWLFLAPGLLILGVAGASVRYQHKGRQALKQKYGHLEKG